MKPHPDDPRLSSYLLGELPPDEAAEIERALAADPALRVTLEELGGTQRMLGDTLGGEEGRLHGWQREAVLRAARDAEAAGKVVDLASGRPSMRPLVVLAAAAVVILAAGWLMWQLPISGRDPIGGRQAGPDWGDPKVEIALLPMPGPAEGRAAPEGAPAGAGFTELADAQKAALHDDPERFLERIGKTLRGAPLPPASKLPAVAERKPVDAARTPVQPLPLIAGTVSYQWLQRAVLDENRLPPKKSVRVGELINAFKYRLGEAVEVNGVRLAMECGACPWDDSANLILVTVDGAADGPRRVAAAFEANAGTIDRYRLLGFGGGSLKPGTAEASPTMIPTAHRVSLMLQIWPVKGATGSAGAIRGRVLRGDGMREFDTPVPFAKPWDDCSHDFRHAALMAGTGLWRGGSDVAPAPEPGQLARLASAEESATYTSDDMRLEALRIIRQAAALATE